MLVKTILNRVQPHKSFVYGAARFCSHEQGQAVEVPIRARANGRPICSRCGQAGPGYERLPERRYEFVPLWGLAVFFLYVPRRVACPRCGVTVERVPWAEGKNRLTTTYLWFLAGWAKRLPWQQVAEAFRTSWQSVYRAVELAVLWGLAHRSLDGIQAVGVDEIQWRKGHRYLTLVYQIERGCKRLLWVSAERTEASLQGFFDLLGPSRAAALRYI